MEERNPIDLARRELLDAELAIHKATALYSNTPVEPTGAPTPDEIALHRAYRLLEGKINALRFALDERGLSDRSYKA